MSRYRNYISCNFFFIFVLILILGEIVIGSVFLLDFFIEFIILDGCILLKVYVFGNDVKFCKFFIDFK